MNCETSLMLRPFNSICSVIVPVAPTSGHYPMDECLTRVVPAFVAHNAASRARSQSATGVHFSALGCRQKLPSACSGFGAASDISFAKGLT